jgi:amidohydrolase
MMNESNKSYKIELIKFVETLKDELAAISDFIFDHPEVGYKEFQASKLLCEFLKKNGFKVEKGYGGLSTAFRAVYENGKGGPCIGLLCEYDAIEHLGHGCAHHLQGPSVIGAAISLKKLINDKPFSIEVIGTPAEETAEGGKNIMLKNGAFKHLDVVMMMHGGDATITDIKSMALSEYLITFKGISAHSAIAPDKGRNALEALMLAFNGIAYLRGHVKDDVRINGIIEDGGQAVNAVTEKAIGRFEFRSFSRPYLDSVIERAMKIFDGAALMTETTYEVNKIADMHNKIPVISLNNLLMDNARKAGAGNIKPPREKTGSTDFASVMYYVPGSCIRVPFVENGMTSHSKNWIIRGKSKEAHEAIIVAAKILAMTAFDIISDEKIMSGIREEFQKEKSKLNEV